MNRIETAVNSLKSLCFSKEEKVRFRGRMMVFRGTEIRGKIMNVGKLMQRKSEKLSRHLFRVPSTVQSDLEIFLGQPPYQKMVAFNVK